MTFGPGPVHGLGMGSFVYYSSCYYHSFPRLILSRAPDGLVTHPTRVHSIVAFWTKLIMNVTVRRLVMFNTGAKKVKCLTTFPDNVRYFLRHKKVVYFISPCSIKCAIK